MEKKKKTRLLDAGLIADAIALIGVFIGAYLNEPKIIGGCMTFLLLLLAFLISLNE